MSKRVVTIDGMGVVDVMDGVAKFLRKVSRGQVDDIYVGEITVVGVVDDCERRTLKLVFRKGDVGTAEIIQGMIQTLKENRGGSVAMLVENLNISDTVSDVELCFVYDTE